MKTSESNIKVIGLKEQFCQVLTSGPSPFDPKKNIGDICFYKKSSLPWVAKSNRASIDMINIAKGAVESKNFSEEGLKKFQGEMEKIKNTMEEMSSKILSDHGGKNPCVPNDPESMANFYEGLNKINSALKPIATMGQPISKKTSSQIFPDGKPACLVTTEAMGLENSHRLNNLTSLEECKKLESSNCSTILKQTQIKNRSCPLELNVLWVNPPKDLDKEDQMANVEIIKSLVCEINGLVRMNQKLTFDAEFKKQSSTYCKKVSGYTCRTRLLSKNGVAEIDSATEIIKTRDGAEFNCLKIAKKVARPHCRESKLKIFAEVILSVEKRVDLNGTLLHKTFEDICSTYQIN
jgi:hypothetical protein